MRNIAVYDLLRQIEKQDASLGAEDLPPRAVGGFAGSLLCVDGATWVSPPEDVQGFYAYRQGWRLHAIDLEWPAPRDLAQLLTDPGIEAMVTQDIDQGLLQAPGMTRANTTLLAFDYLPAIFQRAYLVLGGDDSYCIVDAGSEVVCYPDLVAYLTFWRDVLKAT